MRWVIVNSRGRVRCGPRRQDQLVPQKRIITGQGTKLVPGGQNWLVPQKEEFRQGTSWSQEAGSTRTTKKAFDAGSARTRETPNKNLMTLAQCLRKLTVDL